MGEVEVQPFIERRVDRLCRTDHEQRMAVRRCAHDGFCGDVGTGPRSVLDKELLAEPLRKPLRYQARDDVGRAAGRIADDDAHRPRRIRGTPGGDVQSGPIRMTMGPGPVCCRLCGDERLSTGSGGRADLRRRQCNADATSLFPDRKKESRAQKGSPGFCSCPKGSPSPFSAP